MAPVTMTTTLPPMECDESTVATSHRLPRYPSCWNLAWIPACVRTV